MAESYQQMIDRLQTLIDRTDANAQTAATSGNVINVLRDAYDRAERRFYRDEVSKLPPFEKSVTFENIGPGTRTLAIPADYFEMRYGTVTAQNRTTVLERVAPEQIEDRVNDRQFGVPSRIAYGSNQWLIDNPSQQVNVTVYYYGYLNPISGIGEGTPHWLVNRADDLLLYWAAVECGLYFREIDANVLASWEGKATEIRDAIIQQEVRQRESGSRLRWGKTYTTPDFYSVGTGVYN